jgi:hypothetical protein
METVRKIETLGSSDGNLRVKRVKIYESILQDDDQVSA